MRLEVLLIERMGSENDAVSFPPLHFKEQIVVPLARPQEALEPKTAAQKQVRAKKRYHRKYNGYTLATLLFETLDCLLTHQPFTWQRLLLV